MPRFMGKIAIDEAGTNANTLYAEFRVREVFLNRIISFTVVCCVLWHSVLGCCAHAWQFDASSKVAQSTHSGISSHRCSHGHHHDESSEGDCPCEDHDCRHENCQWVTSAVTFDLSTLLPWNQASHDFQFAIPEAAVPTLTNSATALASPPPLPLRSHLALRILLI